ARAGAAAPGKSPVFIAAPEDLASSEKLREAGFDTMLVPGSALMASPWPPRIEEAASGLGCLVGQPELPFGPRAAQVRGDATIGERQSRLALWAAASLFDAILVPM